MRRPTALHALAFLSVLAMVLALVLHAPAARAGGIGEFISNLPTNGHVAKDWDWAYHDQRTVTWQKGDGQFQTMNPDGTVTDSSDLIVQQYGTKTTWDTEVWSTGAESAAGDRVAVDVLGTHGAAGANVGWSDGNYSANASFYAAGYLIDIEASTRRVDLGDATLGFEGQASGRAFVGAEAEGEANAKINLQGMEAKVQAEFFAGGRAEGEIPVTISLCYMSGSGKVQGQVSYGIGGEAIGTFEIDWANMKAKVSGQLAATLGLGAGAGAEVEVDLGALVRDPGKVADCLVDKLKDLGEAALEVGGDLVDATRGLIDSGTDALGSALASGLEAAQSGLASITSGIVSGITGFLGGKPPAPCRLR